MRKINSEEGDERERGEEIHMNERKQNLKSAAI